MLMANIHHHSSTNIDVISYISTPSGIAGPSYILLQDVGALVELSTSFKGTREWRMLIGAPHFGSSHEKITIQNMQQSIHLSFGLDMGA